MYGVLPSTLKDRLSGRILHGTKSNLVPYFSHEEKNNLETYFVESCKLGMDMERLGNKSKNYHRACDSHKEDDQSSTEWWTKFLQ